MGVRMRDLLMRELGTLRFEPTEKRIRGMLGDVTAVDTTRAMLVWEPKRVVPTYAVPAEDIAAQVDVVSRPSPVDPRAGVAPMSAPQLAGYRVFDPSVPFAVRTTEGDPVEVRVPGESRGAQGFRAAEPALAGYVILDFAGFDAWYEEDERNVGHPRDPFHRIDIVHSSRHVIVKHDDQVIADSSGPYALFEPPLPVRYYLPLEDVRTDLLSPSDTTTFCAYKGKASYWSLDGEDLAWAYREPLREAAEVTERISFFTERVDVLIDGVQQAQPVTPWSRKS